MKKTHKRWLAAALAAVMLTGGVVASADGLPQVSTQSDTQTSTQADTQAINLATLGGVKAEASNVEAQTEFTADMAKDGNTETRWATDQDNQKKGTTARWLKYDLGETRTITGFKVVWQKSNAQTFAIQVSDTGADDSWKDVYTKENATLDSTTTDVTLETPIQAKYVRLNITKYGEAVTGWYNISVCEFEVLGYEEVAPTIGNLARLNGVVATASDTEVPQYPASATIDGNYEDTSRWGTNNDGKGTTERILTLNLGQARTITGFKVFWEKTNIQTYYIETSTNGTDWTQQVFVESAVVLWSLSTS